MTIKYALTRLEIVRVFLASVGRSPRILTIVLVFSLLPGMASSARALASWRTLLTRDVFLAIAWALGMFCFVIAMVFVRGKTQERTLSISEQGISTHIGYIDAQLPWSGVKEVRDSGSYILIVGRTGNSFFVPPRAFQGPAERSRFLSDIRRWHLTA